MAPIPEDCPARLQALDHEDFHPLFRRFVAARWGVEESALDAAPPSPDRGTDVRLPDGRLIHARQYAEGTISANELEELTAVGTRSAVVTTTEFAADARVLAAENGTDLIDGEELCRLLADYGIPIPDADGTTDPRQLAAELAGYWPGEFETTAREIAATIDRVGEFEYDRSRGDYSTELDVVPAGRMEPACKLKFSRSGLLLYVRRPEGWERVVAVSAHTDGRPPGLFDRVQAAVESLD